jgi:H+/Cl- antiporter ClcA
VLSLLAAIVGLAAGGAAYVLVHLIALLTNLALFHRWGWELPSMATLDPGPGLYVAAVGGGLVVALIARWAPIIKGHGIPEAMEAVLTRQSRIAPRTAVAKPLSAAVAIGSGGPFGAEGPVIVTGGALGSLLGQLTHVSPNERKILLASGAAAGMAATFGSPLAAVVLAIELLLFEFSTRAFIPLVVATSIAGGVHAALFGSGPLFSVPTHEFAGLGELPLYAPLGLLCGLLAVVIAKGLFVVEDGYRRLPISPFWHPAIGAIGFATVGLFEPRALGVGYDAIEDVLDGKLAVVTLAGLAVAKLVAWWLALGSGTSGGTLAPLLLVSACVGGTVGELASRALPGVGISPGAFALVAMAATFGAATRATFASIVFVFELTRDYDAILPLMLATVLADLTARHLLHDSLMTEKLTRRGLRVPADFHADVLRTIDVRDVMTRDVVTMPCDLMVAAAVDEFRRGRHGAYPVVDREGRCIGIISRGDLLNQDIDDDRRLGDVARRDVISAVASEPVIVALERML